MEFHLQHYRCAQCGSLKTYSINWTWLFSSEHTQETWILQCQYGIFLISNITSALGPCDMLYLTHQKNKWPAGHMSFTSDYICISCVCSRLYNFHIVHIGNAASGIPLLKFRITASKEQLASGHVVHIWLHLQELTSKVSVSHGVRYWEGKGMFHSVILGPSYSAWAINHLAFMSLTRHPRVFTGSMFLNLKVGKTPQRRRWKFG